MDALFKGSLIPTKDAADISGYTSDYLARLARSGKIIGRKIGHSWFIDKESLEHFSNQQKDHKIDYTRSLARMREAEYRAHRSLTNHKVPAPSISRPSYQRFDIRKIPPRSKIFALFTATSILTFAVLIAQSAIIPQLAYGMVSFAHGISSRFDTALYNSVSSSIVPKINPIGLGIHEQSMKIAIRNPLSFTPITPAIPLPISTPISFTSLVYAPVVSIVALPLSSENQHFSVWSSAYVLLTNPSLAINALMHTFVATGALIVNATHLAIRADVMFAYGLADVAPKSAQLTTMFVSDVGDTLDKATMRVPMLAAAFYLNTVSIPAILAPEVASAIFNIEYAAATQFIALTNTFTSQYYALISDTGRFVYKGAISTFGLTNTTLAYLSHAPSIVKNVYFGIFGKSAFAFNSSSGENPTHTSPASAFAAALPMLSVGERVAFLTYQTIHGLFDSVTETLVSLFGTTSNVAVVSNPPPSILPFSTSTVPVDVSVLQSIVHSTSTQTSPTPTFAPALRTVVTSYPTYTTIVQGVPENFVNNSLATLRANILATVAGMIQPVTAQSATNVTSIQQVNMIQDLSNLVVHNGDFRGGTFDNGSVTNGISVSATTGNFTNLTVGSLSVSGTGTTTFSGPVDASGNFFVNGVPLTISGGSGIVNSGVAGQFPYYTASGTTLTATSSLFISAPGNIGVGTTSPYALLSIGGTNGIGFTLATSTFDTTGGINLASGGCFAISGICMNGGSGTISSVSNTDGTLTISSTSGAVVASLNLANANTWKAPINVDQYSSYEQAGNVVLYASTTNQSLAVGASGAAAWMEATSSPNYSIAIGSGDLQLAPASAANLDSTAIGYHVLASDTTGTGNTANGFNALYYNTTGSDNTANGVDALYANTTGNYNVANGVKALYANTTGTNNVANGIDDLVSNTTGSYNTANGASVLGLNTTGSYNTANGFNALYGNTTGSYNTANGESALIFNTTGTDNTANGASALFYNTTGSDNTANGFQALSSNTTGNNNTANGMNALYWNTIGTNNTANGTNALFLNATGTDNTANGFNALYYNTTGSYNTANGASVLGLNTTGSYNTANGFNALYHNTTGTGSVANGVDVLYSNTTGNDNTANGNSALYSNTTGNYNVAIGGDANHNNISATNTVAVGYEAGYGAPGSYSSYDNTLVGMQAGYNVQTGANDETVVGTNALLNNTTGGADTVIGVDAGYSISTGSYNTTLGYQSGYTLTTGSNNTLIGNFYDTGGGISTGDNNIIIGESPYDGIASTTSNQLDIGNLIYGTGLGSSNTLSAGNVGIGTTSPFATLSVSGAAGSTADLFAISTSSTNFATSTVLIVNSNGDLSLLNGAGLDTQRIDVVLYASQFGGSDAGAKINNCLSALPTSGGTCDARGLTGAQSAAVTIIVPANDTLLLGGVTLTLNGNPGIAYNKDSAILGLSQDTTAIIDEVSNTSVFSPQNPSVTSEYAKIENLSIAVNGATGMTGIQVTNHNFGYFENLLITASTSTEPNTGIVINPNGGSAYFNEFHNLYIWGMATGTQFVNQANENKFYGGNFQGDGVGFEFGQSDHNVLTAPSIEGDTITGVQFDTQSVGNEVIAPRLEFSSGPVVINDATGYNTISNAYLGGTSTSYQDETNTLNFSSSGGLRSYISYASTFGIGTSSEAFRILNNGDVGIGTTSPYSLLSIGTTGGIGFSLATSTFNTTGGINLASGCYAINGACIGGLGGGGTVTSVAASGGTTGLTFTGSPITTSGTLTLGGTLDVANGGTGSTTLSGILLGNGTGAVQTLDIGSGLTFSSSTLSGAVSSVSNVDGTLLVSPTLGAVISSLNLGHANTWTALQQFSANASTTELTTTGATYLAATGGNVGINNTSPAYPLDVNGIINTSQYGGYDQGGNYVLYASTTNKTLAVGASGAATWMSASSSPFYDTAIGYQALNATPSTNLQYNTAIGANALLDNTSGYYNTAIGASALQDNLAGYQNIAIGLNALNQATTSNVFNNVAIGKSSLFSLTNGSYNVGVGINSLLDDTTGYSNLAVGGSALQNNTTGSYNTALGVDALDNATSSNDLTAIGAQALQNDTSLGTGNTGIGFKALYANTTGSSNTAIGANALSSNLTGSGNMAVGTGALSVNTSGNNNLGIGASSMPANTTGSSNVALGYATLYSNTTGGSNVALGSDALLDGNPSNSIAIGYVSQEFNAGGTDNTGIGVYTLQQNTTGIGSIAIGSHASDNNTIANGDTIIGMEAAAGSSQYTATGDTDIGYYSGFNIATSSNYNTLLGYNSGYDLTTGSNNIAIGSNVDLPSNTGSQQLNIGNLIYGTGVYNGSTMSSTPTGGNVGIGTTSPYDLLSIGNTGGIGFSLATSTFNTTGGINLNGGCYAINGACISSGGTGTVTSVGLSTPNSSLTFGGTNPITTSGTISADLNLGHSNWWTALQNFTNASTSKFTATSSVWFTSLANPAGTFLAVDPNGKVIATTSPSGGAVSSVSNTDGTLTISPTSGVVVASLNLANANTWRAPINVDQYSSYEQAGNVVLYASTTNQSLAVGASGAAAWMEATSTLLYDVAIGYNTLTQNTIGNGNTAVGDYSLDNNTTGSGNTANGTDSLYVNSIGSNNSAFGSSALYSNTTGYSNTADGSYALHGNTSGSHNTAIGRDALSSETTGIQNSVLGFVTGGAITTGSNNTILGVGDLVNGITTGNNNIIIGTDPYAGVASTSNNQLDIGNLLYGTGLGSDGTLSTGNIGIGTSSPAYTLDVAGFINTDQYSGYKQAGNTVLYASTTNQSLAVGASGAAAWMATSSALLYDVAVGYQALNVNNTTGDYNTGVGVGALSVNATGNEDSAFGAYALLANTSGTLNTALGAGALYSNTAGGNNTAAGFHALLGNTTGNGNTAVGESALTSNTTSNGNTAVGGSALFENSTGSDNTAVGNSALYLNTIGYNDTASGESSLYSNTTGGNETANGFYALNANTTGSNNTADGSGALVSNITGSDNTASGVFALASNLSATSSTAFGYEAGYGTGNYYNQGGTYLGAFSDYSAATSSDFNTILGYQSGYNVTTGSNNVLIGAATSSAAIANLTTGSQNILIGSNISLPSATASGQLNIGNVIYGTGNTGTGSAVSAGNIGIGTTSPWRTLSVSGTMAIAAPSISTTGDYLCWNTTTGEVEAGTSCTLSSERFKDNIVPLSSTSGLDEVMALKPVSFNFKQGYGDNGSTTQLGFIAEQAVKVDPRLVTFGVHGNPNGFVYPNFTSILTKAIQDVNNGYTLHNVGLGATSTIASWYTGTTTPAITVDATGNVGIGMTDPHHTLDISGDISSMAFVNSSTKDSMTGISYLNASSTGELFNQLLNLKVATYRYTNESQSDPLSLGLVAEDAQTIAPEILSPDGKGIDLYKLATFTLSGVQTLAAKVNAEDVRVTSLEARVAALESGAVSSASGSPVSFSTSSLASALNSFGILIQKGIAQFNTLVFHQLVASTDANGTSSAGSVTVLAGNTVALVNNSLVQPSTKVFITFNSQITGSWWVSDKTAGSFRVMFSAPQTSDVSFDYLLIQTEGQIVTPSAGGVSGGPQSGNSDSLAPISITLLGNNPLYLPVGSIFVEPGIVVTDSIDGTDPYTTFINGVQQTISSSTIDTSSPTTYLITYKATDSAGNTTTAIRSVIVGNPDGTVSIGSGDSSTGGSTVSTTIPATTTQSSSNTPPLVVTLNGAAAMQIQVGDTFIDPGATATDSVDGDLTNKIQETGMVSTTTPGIYTLTYSVTDTAGNIGTASRVVTVIAATLPVASSTSSMMSASTASTTDASTTPLTH